MPPEWLPVVSRCNRAFSTASQGPRLHFDIPSLDPAVSHGFGHARCAGLSMSVSESASCPERRPRCYRVATDASRPMAVALLAEGKHVYPCGAFGINVVRRRHSRNRFPTGAAPPPRLPEGSKGRFVGDAERASIAALSSPPHCTLAGSEGRAQAGGWVGVSRDEGGWSPCSSGLYRPSHAPVCPLSDWWCCRTHGVKCGVCLTECGVCLTGRSLRGGGLRRCRSGGRRR